MRGIRYIVSVTRRDLVRAGAMTAVSYSRVIGANDRIRMGYIGIGNRGDQVHDAFLEHGDAQTVAVCDLREDYMEFAGRKSRGTPKKYKEYRKLLDDKDVDAVVIATPDHWHALQFIHACDSGKDVYVEKPFSLTVTEGRKMVQTAERTKRVVQVGIQRRSSKFLQEASEFIRSGGIGHVTVAKGYHVTNEWPNGIGSLADGPAPTDFEWDQWLGPAPKVPYNKNRSFYNFRWFYNYSGGQVTNFGVHYFDMLRWCLGQDAANAVTVMGGKYAVKDNREIPDTLEALWETPGPAMIVFSQYNANASGGNPQSSDMELRGTKGTVYLHSNRWEVVPERVTEATSPARTPVDRAVERTYGPTKKAVIEPKGGKGSIDTAFHARNFLDCVKSRSKTNCDALTGHLSTVGPLIANIALRTKSYLEWDAAAERFTNNPAANKLLSYEYRAPYRLG